MKEETCWCSYNQLCKTAASYDKLLSFISLQGCTVLQKTMFKAAAGRSPKLLGKRARDPYVDTAQLESLCYDLPARKDLKGPEKKLYDTLFDAVSTEARKDRARFG